MREGISPDSSTMWHALSLHPLLSLPPSIHSSIPPSLLPSLPAPHLSLLSTRSPHDPLTIYGGQAAASPPHQIATAYPPSAPPCAAPSRNVRRRMPREASNFGRGGKRAREGVQESPPLCDRGSFRKLPHLEVPARLAEPHLLDLLQRFSGPSSFHGSRYGDGGWGKAA